ncbi:helix-turn-helix transcriptional regulator [Staphylococcus chromogenes]|uniref:helix-turn-helix transcriptional regulator n=2 Tax=Staphylococcus chromogenes TaxID=46126 RepID=UPI000D0407BD|nr:HTH domain-containing protein [Staphylococcus chromogenes]MCD9071841.1 HTH domain-containing protein [Staphylococcus chromogenes]MCE5043621.1 HTH domain-containing protein [Staphylococcus chromogenes]MEB7432834.1 HTH domain-containing protein [Staphylococcus chromogenes]RIL88561.1 HTH domain-containing protein [Staphylococcus chromogenes]RIL94793.1 HTH domain-containing protein [Staphylococcus chromogenes]
MDRAFRILTIYHRLLQNKKVNKKSLALMLNTSTRTIQRDIDDIRNFLYESEHWLDTQYEVKYDYDFESYTINHDKNENLYYMYDILTKLYVTMPTISYPFYRYLKELINKHHSNHQNELYQYLDKFIVDSDIPSVSNLAITTQAINTKNYLLKDNENILPITLNYNNYGFYLTYLMEGHLLRTNVGHLNIQTSNKSFKEEDITDERTQVTLEMTKDIWKDIHLYYENYIIEKYFKNLIVVTIEDMLPYEAIQLCFNYRSQVRIISPLDLREIVIDELLLLQSIYLKQRIQK